MAAPATIAMDGSIAEESLPGRASIRDYCVLLKPGVMTLVVFTGAVGMFLAPGKLHPLLAVISVIAIALGSGAGAVINMWFDRDIDAIMTRTASRPIPAGRIAPDDALAMGIMLALLAVGLLGMASNWFAAAMLAFAIIFYAVIYTMLLKRTTTQNIVVGGLAGALPPVIGWASVTGGLALLPWLLCAIIFLWTPPHFWALALYRHGDYARAKIPMLPVVAGVTRTKHHILAYSIVLAFFSLTPLYTGSGLIYAIAAVALGGRFIQLAVMIMRSDAPKDAMRLFGFSILYLFALFSALAIDKVTSSFGYVI
jgi:protoheme IX farnesyltransferase